MGLLAKPGESPNLLDTPLLRQKGRKRKATAAPDTNQPVIASSKSRRCNAAPRKQQVVSGFGGERCEDVVAPREQLDADMLQRAGKRREQGLRGRVLDLFDRDVDRCAGGAWHAGRGRD